jgi:Mlc titration factor MtfA (ptsG expression regulator)
MAIQTILIFAVVAFGVYMFMTAIDLQKAIIALLTGKKTPTYFEFFPRKLPLHYKRILLKNNKYYRSLSPKLQKSFGSRMMKFLHDKHFEVREELRLTTEMKILIASAAIKITFGLRNYMFKRFHTIIIYADEFYSKTSEQYAKGETDASGVIVFSWEDLLFGNSIPDDSINLGYHEFAHALFIEHLFDPYNSKFKDYYREWLVFIRNNDKLEEATDRKIFRAYAAENEMEFFAVALENFFERPDHFKEELPKLYGLMSEMLNQDLANP